MLLLFRGPSGPVIPPTSPTVALQTAGRTLKLYALGAVLSLPAASRVLTFWGDTMAEKFPEPFDPSDIQFYTFDLSPLLNGSENIASATVAIDGGLTIGGAGYPNVVGAKTVGFWVRATNTGMAPVDAVATVTVTTNSSPARRLQRSGIIEVRQLG
jgi:hypothetical protein